MSEKKGVRKRKIKPCNKLVRMTSKRTTGEGDNGVPSGEGGRAKFLYSILGRKMGGQIMCACLQVSGSEHRHASIHAPGP